MGSTPADHSTSALFQPLQVGTNTLAHRVVLAPLTRFRASSAHVPLLPMVAEYYSQRAAIPGTQLTSEAAFISPRGAGNANVPGLYEPAQLAAWKQVTDAVHAKGSFIYAQLWALGRAADKGNLKEEYGLDVVSSSDIPLEGREDKPRALEESEIEEFIRDYATAARNAVEVAGFDGVEIHGANGYLVDQFIQDTANKRTDKWGGSVENRARFAVEVTKAVVAAVGAERTAIRLSPFSSFQGMKMADPKPTFKYLVEQLRGFKLAYLHLVESRINGNMDTEGGESLDFLIEAWGKTSPVFLAGGFLAKSALETVEHYKSLGSEVAIVFGRYFIANPDLPYRVLKGIEFEPYDRNRFYNKGEEYGYIDYQASKEFQAEYGSVKA